MSPMVFLCETWFSLVEKMHYNSITAFFSFFLIFTLTYFSVHLPFFVLKTVEIPVFRTAFYLHFVAIIGIRIIVNSTASKILTVSTIITESQVKNS